MLYSLINERNQGNDFMKKRKMVVTTVLFVIICFLITTLISAFSLNKAVNQNDAAMAKLLASTIYDSINNELSKPITVSRTMANDRFLIESLKQESAMSEQNMEQIMADYLTDLKENLGYDSAFVVSDKTNRYYSYNGISKIISPGQGHDVWYTDFLKEGKENDLDVDEDEINGNNLTIFVNNRVEDKDGNLLGVCGAGVEISRIQEILHSYEREYGIKINLLNPDGVVQVDTDTINIENLHFSDELKKQESADQPYTFEKAGKNGFLITRYIEDLDWYLLVYDEGKLDLNSMSDLVCKNLLVFLGILMFLIICIRNILTREKNDMEQVICTDKLTGAANRNYFRYHVDEKNLHSDFHSLAIFDIDNFKTINDTKGHTEGDMILKTVSDICTEIMGKEGRLIRWGGDEFLILFSVHGEEAHDLCEKFRQSVEKDTCVTISLGLIQIREGESLEKAVDRADAFMYKSKQKGRNSVTSI